MSSERRTYGNLVSLVLCKEFPSLSRDRRIQIKMSFKTGVNIDHVTVCHKQKTLAIEPEKETMRLV